MASFGRYGIVVGALSWIQACSATTAEPKSASSAAPQATQPSHVAQEKSEPLKPAAASVPASEEPEPEAASQGLPTECIRQGKLCLPPSDFAQRICDGSYPSVALLMFEKSSPWSRGYIRVREVNQYSTPGGRTNVAQLVFTEEVIILRHRSGDSSSGIKVSGMGGYDVLRWDGSCATLAEDELASWVPASPQTAPIVWKYLEEPIQDALLENERIKKARQAHREKCQGSSLGEPSKACQRAMKLLNERIAFAVRQGMALPAPTRLP